MEQHINDGRAQAILDLAKVMEFALLPRQETCTGHEQLHDFVVHAPVFTNRFIVGAPHYGSCQRIDFVLHCVEDDGQVQTGHPGVGQYVAQP
jgi:hypothetical protein